MIREKDLQEFKDHQVTAKSIFRIREIDKRTCYEFVRRHHYLGDAKFFCVHGYGLYYKNGEFGDEMVGCATYSAPQGTVSLDGWFGLGNDCDFVLELSRLCLIPELNGTNATSFLLGNSMRMLKKHGVKAVITLADSTRHVGSIYQVCNFRYYGLTDKKQDFYSENGYKNPRGKTHDKHGVWIDRPRKHRYCYLLDKRMRVLYQEQQHPKQDMILKPYCCGGTHKVYDQRFGEWWSCPVCLGYMKKANDDVNATTTRLQNGNSHAASHQLLIF